MKQIKILLVEDDPTNQEIAIYIFQDAGYYVELANNGFEAIEKFNNSSFDIIFMDIQIPKIDGIKVTKIIRNFDTHIPIIALTGSNSIKLKTKCLKAGMNDYIRKPISKEIIIRCVEKYV
jgi:CheY-like chemotaxis protein